MGAPRITKEELKKKMDGNADMIILDVRNPHDYAESNIKIPGSIRIPLAELPERVKELDPAKEVIAYCT